MKLIISTTPHFGESLFCWRAILPDKGKGQIHADWSHPDGGGSVRINRHRFALSEPVRAALIESAIALRYGPSRGFDGLLSHGVAMDGPGVAWITVDSGGEEMSTGLMLHRIPVSSDVQAFSAIVDAVWPDVREALSAAGLVATDWRTGAPDQ